MYVNTFICLEENVAGYGKNKKHPSGHVTIASPGVVKCYIQDLEKIAKPYIVYLVSKKANKAIRLGQINCPETSKQTVWKIDMGNIQGSNVGAKDIDCVVVVVEGEGIGNTDTVLSGYTQEKYMTTSLIENALPKKMKVEPKAAEIKQEPAPKPVQKATPKPEPKPEPKPVPEPESKPEPKPMPKPEVMPEIDLDLDTDTVVEEEPVSTSKEEGKGNCGFQIKDGKIEDEIVTQIKNMLNNENARKESKEQLEKEILSQVERILDKDKIAEKLEQDFKDLQNQMNTILDLGVSELDRADEMIAMEREEEPVECEECLENVGDDTEQEDAYLKDIEKVLHTIQETMQNEMAQKKKNPHKSR